MSYVFFTSYARANTEYPQFAEAFSRFINELSAEVQDRIKDLIRDQERPYFMDTQNIKLGAPWPEDLKEAVIKSKICIAIYSPAYFASPWCGKEFEVFRRRNAPIIPVLWVYPPRIPESIRHLQYVNDKFPREYGEKGLKQLMLQESTKDLYRKCVEALADRIIEVYSTDPVRPFALELETVVPAWGVNKVNQNEPKTISKTCFVYVAEGGWHWKPYPQTQETIGALSQQLSGQLGLQYEEIQCDADFSANLLSRNKENVPTLLLADPASLATGKFDQKMQEYDKQYLLNCGALLAWPEATPATAGNQNSWDYIKQWLFPQKTASPPPHHEWRSIFSPDDLKGKTLATLESIRLRLLQSMLQPESGASVRKAEDPDAVRTAASEGIRLETVPQLTSTVQPK